MKEKVSRADPEILRAKPWIGFPTMTSLSVSAFAFVCLCISYLDGGLPILGVDEYRVQEPGEIDRKSSGSYADFLSALRARESEDNYAVVNSLNFLGAYQFGEAALIDLGYVLSDDDSTDNDFGGGFSGKDEIHSVSDFLSSPDIQERAVREWMRLMWSYISATGLRHHVCEEIRGVTLSPSGMLAATHLLGVGPLLQFVESDGLVETRDPYGTSLKDYLIEFENFDTPFADCSVPADEDLDAVH